MVFTLTADFRGWISIVEGQSKVDSRYCGCPLCFNLTPTNKRLAFDSYIKIDKDFTPKTFKRMIYIFVYKRVHIMTFKLTTEDKKDSVMKSYGL